jgi:hypothetical protein
VTGRTRLLLGALAVVVLAGAVVGGILVLRDEDPPTDYDARTEDDFMAACTADAEARGFVRAEDHCRCAYDAIREEIPYERFLEIDADLVADPDEVPPVLDRIRAACYLETEAAGPSIPLTTAPTTTEPA